MSSHRRTGLLAAILCAAAAPVVFDRGAIGAASALHHLAYEPNPYVVPSQAWLLYVRAPLAAVSAFLLVLSPGLLCALALRSSERFERWLMTGFGFSLILVSTATALVQELLGRPPREGTFVFTIFVLCGAALVFLQVRLRQGRFVANPLSGRRWRATALGLGTAAYVLVAALAPKIFWESFNDDGAQAFESSRLLLTRAFPFWEAEAGTIAAFPGLTTMLFAFPGSWFVRLFGELEASVRFPFVLYLMVLYTALIAVAEEARERLRAIDRWLFVLPLLAYGLAMSFSATYDPYSADLALPATTDTLLIVTFLGAVLAFLRAEMVLLCLWTTLTFLVQPNGTLLLALWGVAALVFLHPRPVRPTLVLGSTLTACVIFSSSAAWWTEVIGLPGPGGEHAGVALLSRIDDRQLAEWLLLHPLRRPEYWQRWLFLFIPCGIVPALALFDWKRLDPPARALAAATIAYFVAFYIQAQTNLHYFAPAMVMPLTVLCRSRWLGESSSRRLVLPAAAAGGVAAVLLSLPQSAKPVTAARTVGSSLEVRFGGYEQMNPAFFRALDLFSEVIPRGYTPEKHYGGSPLVWNYYAQGGANERTINYVLQPTQEPPPAGMRLAARDQNAAVFVADDSVLAAHLSLRPPTPPGARLYALPRATMFPRGGAPIREVLRDVARRLGFRWR